MFDNATLPAESLSAIGAEIYIPFEVKHSIPGRLRVVSEACIANKTLLEAVNTKILSIAGIKETSLNNNCGSIAINYDEQLINEACILRNLSIINLNLPAIETNSIMPVTKSLVLDVNTDAKPNRLYEAVGGLLAGAGVIGIIIPGIPGIPILLLSAYFLSRSSGPLYKKLLENEYIGRYLKKTDKPALNNNLKK